MVLPEGRWGLDGIRDDSATLSFLGVHLRGCTTTRQGLVFACSFGILCILNMSLYFSDMAHKPHL